MSKIGKKKIQIPKKVNVKIPKGTDPKLLKREECLILMENQPAKQARGKK